MERKREIGREEYGERERKFLLFFCTSDEEDDGENEGNDIVEPQTRNHNNKTQPLEIERYTI